MNTMMRILPVMALHFLVMQANAQGPGTPRTLFGDSTELTGVYFSMSARYTNVLSTDVVDWGFGLAAVVNHKLNLGLAGAWSTSVLKNPAYQQYLVDGGQTNDLSGLELKYGYGGLLVEPLLFHRSAVHVALPVIIGVGGINYSYPAPNGNNSQRNRVDGQAFFALEPGLEVELSVVGPLRVGFGGSYLFTSDISLPETPPDVLRTAMARMTLKFGSF